MEDLEKLSSQVFAPWLSGWGSWTDIGLKLFNLAVKQSFFSVDPIERGLIQMIGDAPLLGSLSKEHLACVGTITASVPRGVVELMTNYTMVDSGSIKWAQDTDGNDSLKAWEA